MGNAAYRTCSLSWKIARKSSSNFWRYLPSCNNENTQDRFNIVGSLLIKSLYGAQRLLTLADWAVSGAYKNVARNKKEKNFTGQSILKNVLKYLQLHQQEVVDQTFPHGNAQHLSKQSLHLARKEHVSLHTRATMAYLEATLNYYTSSQLSQVSCLLT